MHSSRYHHGRRWFDTCFAEKHAHVENSVENDISLKKSGASSISARRMILQDGKRKLKTMLRQGAGKIRANRNRRSEHAHAPNLRRPPTEQDRACPSTCSKSSACWALWKSTYRPHLQKVVEIKKSVHLNRIRQTCKEYMQQILYIEQTQNLHLGCIFHGAPAVFWRHAKASEHSKCI